MRMIAIHAQTERKRLDRSVRCAEKRRPWARKQRLRGLIRPDPAVCATAGAACGRKSLSSARIQAIFTSNDTPLGECRLRRCVGSITPKALAQTLRRLERNGIVAREIIPGAPPGVEYRTTELGLSLAPAVMALLEWSSKHHCAVEQAQSDFDARALETPNSR